jgi:hypothetical protein
MVLAWIAWRDFEEVREWDPDYCRECRDWTRSERNPNGWVLKRRSSPTGQDFEYFGYLSRLERQSADLKRPPPDVDLPRRAKKELWEALEEGEAIAGNAIPYGGSRSKVPAIEWQDLETYVDRRGLEVLRYRQQARTYPAYTSLTFPRAQVITRWPKRAQNDAPLSTVGDETRAKANLRLMARAHIENGAPIPVRAVWRESCGLGPRAEARVWGDVAKEFPFLSERAGKPKRRRGA